MTERFIKVLAETEMVDGRLWRLLPKAVETDNDGRHWIPESKVVVDLLDALIEENDEPSL